MNDSKLDQVLNTIVEGTIKQKFIWKNYREYPSFIKQYINNEETINDINFEEALFFEKENQIILLTGNHRSNNPNSFALFIIDKNSKIFSKYILDYPNYVRITNHIQRAKHEQDRMLDDFLK